MTRPVRLAWNIIGIALALLIWEAAGRLAGEGLLAPPSEVAVNYPTLLQGGMPATLAEALGQMFAGYALSLLVGIPVGMLMGRSETADAVLHPWIGMIVVTSTAALIPLFILVFGTGFSFTAALVFMASAFYIMLTTYQGARGIDAKLLAVGRSFGATRAQMFRTILLPGLFPYLVTGARIGLTHAIRAVVMGQMFVMVGFGGLIAQAGLDASTAGLLGLLVTIMIVSIVLNAALDLVGRYFAPWYRSRTG